jgi:multidrug resistance efflux pump
LLATVDDLALEQELARLRDDLRIARATLDAELAKLRWNMQLAGNRQRDRTAELHEFWERLAGDKAALRKLQVHRDPLSFPRQTNDSGGSWGSGQRGAKSAEDVDVETRDMAPLWLEERAGPTGTASESDDDRLRPTLARIRDLRAEIECKQRHLARGQLRSPLSGIVIKKHSHCGETVDQADPLMEILEEGSLVAVVFFPQSQSECIELGDRIPIAIGPSETVITGVVKQLADHSGPAPPPLRQYYEENEPLLAVHLQPEFSSGAELNLELGSVVKVPHRGRRSSSWSGPPP